MVPSCRRTLANWPGHSVPSALGNTARARKVPLSVLIWLSTTSSSPSLASTLLPPRALSCTGTLPALRAWRTAPSSRSGRLNSTWIGCTWVRVTRAVPADTMLPASTLRMPATPVIGAVTRVYCSSTWAARMLAALAATALSYWATWLRWVSRSVCDTYWRYSGELERWKLARAVASSASFWRLAATAWS